MGEKGKSISWMFLQRNRKGGGGRRCFICKAIAFHQEWGCCCYYVGRGDGKCSLWLNAFLIVPHWIGLGGGGEGC